MRQFYYLLASMIMMVMGSANAYADNWSIDLKGLVTQNATCVIDGDSAVTVGNVSLAPFSYNDIAVDSKLLLQTGTTWLMRTGGLYQMNSGARSFGLNGCTAGQTITITGDGEPTVGNNVTKQSSSGNTYVFKVTADGAVSFSLVRYKYIYTIAVEDPSATAVEYTVKFVDQDGNSIKDDVTYEGEPGAAITVSDGDKVNIVNNGVTYLYVSDDAEGKTIANDGSTVVTLTFRKAEIYGYFVKEVAGDNVFCTTYGEAVEGSTVKMPFHKYNKAESILYSKDPINKEYNYTFTLTERNQTELIEYTATNIDNVQFLEEGENINGMTLCTSANTAVRSSNSSSAYPADGKVKIATLMEGTYKIIAGIYDANSTPDSHWVFTDGNNNTVADLNCTVINLQELTSDNFTLTDEATPIYLEKQGSSKMGLDYVIIIGDGGTAEVDNEIVYIGSTGYATLYYENENLEVPAGVTATTYTLDGNNLVESTVYEVGDVIPCGEAVVLQGKYDSYDFDIVNTDNLPDPNNVLKGTDEETTISESGYKYYILTVSNDEEKNVGFYFQNEDGSSVVNGEHKAYLQVDASTAVNMYFLFNNDNVDAISPVVAGERTSDAIYDLQGRRVTNVAKGIYIKNGKKFVVK